MRISIDWSCCISAYPKKEKLLNHDGLGIAQLAFEFSNYEDSPEDGYFFQLCEVDAREYSERYLELDENDHREK